MRTLRATWRCQPQCRFERKQHSPVSWAQRPCPSPTQIQLEIWIDLRSLSSMECIEELYESLYIWVSDVSVYSVCSYFMLFQHVSTCFDMFWLTLQVTASCWGPLQSRLHLLQAPGTTWHSQRHSQWRLGWMHLMGCTWCTCHNDAHVVLSML